MKQVSIRSAIFAAVALLCAATSAHAQTQQAQAIPVPADSSGRNSSAVVAITTPSTSQILQTVQSGFQTGAIQAPQTGAVVRPWSVYFPGQTLVFNNTARYVISADGDVYSQNYVTGAYTFRWSPTLRSGMNPIGAISCTTAFKTGAVSSTVSWLEPVGSSQGQPTGWALYRSAGTKSGDCYQTGEMVYVSATYPSGSMVYMHRHIPTFDPGAWIGNNLAATVTIQ